MGTRIAGTSATAIVLALTCVVPGRAQATSLEITPVAINLVPGQHATTIAVMNRGGVAAAIQLRAFVWTQDGDSDVLTPSQNIILSPPIFTVAKDKTQTIRLLLRPGRAGSGERAYRLLIDEVPPVNARDRQINIAMRISVPIIIGAVAPPSHALQWQARRRGPGEVLLSATNAGTGYERIGAIAVTLPDGSHPGADAVASNPYILAGAQRHWIVHAATASLKLRTTTRSGESEQSLAVDP